MDFFTAMEVSASGLSAQRTRMNIAASNLATVNTTAPGGVGTYARKMVELESVPYPGAGVNGVKVKQIVSDAAPPREEFDPEHPDADANGYVYYPNVNQAVVTAWGTIVATLKRAVTKHGFRER